MFFPNSCLAEVGLWDSRPQAGLCTTHTFKSSKPEHTKAAGRATAVPARISPPPVHLPNMVGLPLGAPLQRLDWLVVQFVCAPAAPPCFALLWSPLRLQCAGAALNPATACSADESMKACASRCGDDPLPPELKCDCSDPAGSAAALGLTGAVCGSDGLVYPELCTLRVSPLVLWSYCGGQLGNSSDGLVYQDVYVVMPAGHVMLWRRFGHAVGSSICALLPCRTWALAACLVCLERCPALQGALLCKRSTCGSQHSQRRTARSLFHTPAPSAALPRSARAAPRGPSSWATAPSSTPSLGASVPPL